MEFGYPFTYNTWQDEYDTIEEALDSLNETFDTMDRPLDRRFDRSYEERIDAINDQRPLFEDVLASDELAHHGLALLERMVTEKPSRFKKQDIDNLHFRGYQIISVNDQRIMELAGSDDPEVAGRALRLIYTAGGNMYSEAQASFITGNFARFAWNATQNPYLELHDPKYATETLISCACDKDRSIASDTIRAAYNVMYTPETTEFGTAAYEGLISYAFRNNKAFGGRKETVELYKARPELLDYKLSLEDYLCRLSCRDAKEDDVFEMIRDVDIFYKQTKTDPAMLEAFQRSVGVHITLPHHTSAPPILYERWMSATGHSFNTYLRAWNDGCGDKMSPQGYEDRNIEAMAAIELIEPGAVKALTEEFGIRNFVRYPTRTMVNQYRNKDNKDLDYGVYIMSQTDHNGAFHPSNGHSHLIDSFERGLGQIDAGMRIYEVGSIMGAARAVLEARHKYEKQLHFAVIGGHGTPSTLQLNSADLFEGYIRRMHIRRIRDRPADRMMNIFTNDATIILDSCSTGQIDGLAEELNDFLSAEAYAPRTPTKLESIDILSGDQPSSFVLIPRYRDAGAMGHFPRPQRKN